MFDFPETVRQHLSFRPSPRAGGAHNFFILFFPGRGLRNAAATATSSGKCGRNVPPWTMGVNSLSVGTTRLQWCPQRGTVQALVEQLDNEVLPACSINSLSDSREWKVVQFFTRRRRLWGLLAVDNQQAPQHKWRANTTTLLENYKIYGPKYIYWKHKSYRWCPRWCPEDEKRVVPQGWCPQILSLVFQTEICGHRARGTGKF